MVFAPGTSSPSTVASKSMLRKSPFSAGRWNRHQHRKPVPQARKLLVEVLVAYRGFVDGDLHALVVE